MSKLSDNPTLSELIDAIDNLPEYNNFDDEEVRFHAVNERAAVADKLEELFMSLYQAGMLKGECFDQVQDTDFEVEEVASTMGFLLMKGSLVTVSND